MKAVRGTSTESVAQTAGCEPEDATNDVSPALTPAETIGDTAHNDSQPEQIGCASASSPDSSEMYCSPMRDMLDQLDMDHDASPTRRTKHASLALQSSFPYAIENRDTMPILSAMDIGRRVKDVRLDMGVTQQRFADMAGVGRRFLIELEHGKTSLEIGRVLAVCQAAGIRLGFIE